MEDNDRDEKDRRTLTSKGLLQEGSKYWIGSRK
jgi:hypothetical protein